MNTNSLNWPLLAAALLPWSAIVAAAIITPRLTRPDLFFAVTVKPSFRASSEGAHILRLYNWLVLALALPALAPLVCLRFFRLSPLLGLLGPALLELAGCFAAFLVARGQTLPHHVEPSTGREALLSPRKVSLPGGWLAQAGPFLLLMAAAICLGVNWSEIPQRIVIHWGSGGEPNGWAVKSPASVFGGPAFGALICLLLAGSAYAIVRGRRRIHSAGRAALGEARFIGAISLLLLGIEYWLALLMGWFSLTALRHNPASPLPALWPILIGDTLLITAVFVIACRMGQGGWRFQTDAGNENSSTDVPPLGDRTPDECWKLGVFYFNRNDSAIFVEKRFGVGWTLNFGNWRSWLVTAAILSFILAGLLLSLLLSHGGSH